MAKEQWDVRSNLKNKPNAQGTLFSGGASQMNPKKRYPRGYTPERQNDVANTVIIEGLNGGGIGEYRSSAHAVRETLARSSAPVEDMRGLHIAVSRPHEYPRNGLNDADGVYRATQRHVRGMRAVASAGSISLRPTAMWNDTVIHELGHHVSAREGTDHSLYETPLQRGKEEGFADAYADKHFVEHPQAKKMMLDERRGLSDYPASDNQLTSHDGFYRRAAFYDGYSASRPMNMRVPNNDDLQKQASQSRFDTAAQRRRTQPQLPGFESPEQIRGNTPPVPTAQGSVPPPPPPERPSLVGTKITKVRKKT